MAFLDKVTDLTRAAAKRSGEMVEAGKVAIEISKLRSEIKDIHIEIGKVVCRLNNAGITLDPELRYMCEEVEEKLRAIEALEAEKEMEK
ncbi:MAG: hypothetical protein IJO79_02280 [Firmicutes bacterium]|nr:hypothetical protein [Bacillota bacterium]